MENILTDKISLAVELLKEGKSAHIGMLRLLLEGSENLIVIGWSHILNFSNLTKENSLSDMANIKLYFADLLSNSGALKAFVENKKVSYELRYDDAGKTSITICTDANGEVNWLINLS